MTTPPEPLQHDDGVPSVSIVIPVHNEAGYLPGALEELFDELESVPATVSVLIAENGSTDATADEVRKAMDSHSNLGILQLPDPDYGAAMRQGFLHTSGDWVINFDIDYFSGEFLRTVLVTTDRADIILASKRVEGADDRRGATRRLATWAFNLILRLVLKSGVSDTHGMKALRRIVVDDIAPRVVSTQDLFDTELVVRAERAGYRIVEVPAVVEERRETSSSIWKRVPRTLRGVWKIRRDLNKDEPVTDSA